MLQLQVQLERDVRRIKLLAFTALGRMRGYLELLSDLAVAPPMLLMSQGDLSPQLADLVLQTEDGLDLVLVVDVLQQRQAVVLNRRHRDYFKILKIYCLTYIITQDYEEEKGKGG
jgi:hypothetical protein